MTNARPAEQAKMADGRSAKNVLKEG